MVSQRAGVYCPFEGRGDDRFPGLGINLNVLVLAVGTRGKDDIVYPANETAVKHGVGVETETKSPAEAYAHFSKPEEGPTPELS